MPAGAADSHGDSRRREKSLRANPRFAPISRPVRIRKPFPQLSGNRVFLKLENLQMTGAYKERGALNKILELTQEERDRGLIAASAGNHAQAVSYHASKRGIAAQIVMPIATPLNKVMATRRFGGDVVLHGANYDEACDEAMRRAAESGLTFIHAFDDDAVIAGQGTLGLELLSQTPDIDVVITAIGGGGLISGMACALKEINPRIQVIGVQTSRLPSMKAAIDAGHLVTLPVASTLADGIAVRRAGERTLPMVHKYVDEIVTVEEEEIASAILLLLEREKTVAEGAGQPPSPPSCIARSTAPASALPPSSAAATSTSAFFRASSSAASPKTDASSACASICRTTLAPCTP